MSSNNAFLFESDFSVENKDLGGKKFDRVSRFQLESMNKDVVVVIDVATSLYPLRVNDRVSIALCSTINIDGSPSDGNYDQTKKISSEAQNSEYIMHGSSVAAACVAQRCCFAQLLVVYSCTFRLRARFAPSPSHAGRVFKYKYHEDHRVSIYVSFGGLLMCIRGHQMKLVNIEPDSAVYLLMKRLKK